MSAYLIRFECRAPGSIGAFQAIVFTVDAATPAEARDKAFAIAQEHYETRFGGDYCLGDESVLGPRFRIWRNQDGTEARMLLPCQEETVKA